MENRTIKAIAELNEKVYVYLENDDVCRRFLADAEAEGFTFGDGAKPTEKHCSDIIAVNTDMTVSYVTTIGKIAFRSGAGNITKIDYMKYISGSDDFICSK